MVLVRVELEGAGRALPNTFFKRGNIDKLCATPAVVLGEKSVVPARILVYQVDDFALQVEIDFHFDPFRQHAALQRLPNVLDARQQSLHLQIVFQTIADAPDIP